MQGKSILLVAGARPNFLKIFPVLRGLAAYPGLQPIIVHTGQHYDHAMAESFFELFEVPSPKHHLHVGSGSHAVQTANIMIRFEEVCQTEAPGLVVVVGDVNSTIAAGLVAKKCKIDLAHVEAGLRSGDRGMPEEINRRATDAITDLFFTTEEEGSANLLCEGHSPDRIHFVGNVMIDSLFEQLKRMQRSGAPKRAARIRELLCDRYLCMTLHRPSNVDNPAVLSGILGAVHALSREVPVVFPVHPRTRKQIEQFGLTGYFESLDLRGTTRRSNGLLGMDSLAYDEFLFLWKDSLGVLTDSGGLQEETTALKVPCITLRENTERPVTQSLGSNAVIGTDPKRIAAAGMLVLRGEWKSCQVPPLWDGKAGQRIAATLAAHLGEKP